MIAGSAVRGTRQCQAGAINKYISKPTGLLHALATTAHATICWMNALAIPPSAGTPPATRATHRSAGRSSNRELRDVRDSRRSLLFAVRGVADGDKVPFLQRRHPPGPGSAPAAASPQQPEIGRGPHQRASKPRREQAGAPPARRVRSATVVPPSCDRCERRGSREPSNVQSKDCQVISSKASAACVWDASPKCCDIGERHSWGKHECSGQGERDPQQALVARACVVMETGS